MRNKKGKVVKLVVGCGCTAVIVIFLIIAILDYRDRHVVLDYQSTFIELAAIPQALVDGRLKVMENEISQKQYNELVDSFRKISIYTIIYEEFPTENMKEFNNNVRKIFGADSPYIINVKYQRDYDGFIEGMAYWQFDFSIRIMWIAGEIPDETFYEYQSKSDEFLQNFSRDKVIDMYKYMQQILNDIIPDEAVINDPGIL